MWLAGSGEFLRSSTDLTTRHPGQADRLTAVGLVGITQNYGNVLALHDVSLELGPGITVLLGRNGAGKSTLCRTLTGIERPDAGHIRHAGRALVGSQDRRAHHAQTGWLPQHIAAPLSMKVEQYLRYACWLKDVNAKEVEARIVRALARTDLVEHRRRPLRHLSGGMLRRAGIAQAAVHEPSLLVLDEPTVGLDPEQRAWFHHTVRELAKDRIVFISTHLLEDVEAFPGRVVVLNLGEVCFDGSTDDLAARGRRSRLSGTDAATEPHGKSPDHPDDSDTLSSHGIGSPQEELRAGFLSVLAESDRRRGRSATTELPEASPGAHDAERPGD